MTLENERLTGRDRSRLRRARERGYLNASCKSGATVREAYSFWCWRLRLPVVWFERVKPGSKFGRVGVDLFTTSNVLNEFGEAALIALGNRLGVGGPDSMSPHDLTWSRVPVGCMEELAKAALRIVLLPGNYEAVEFARMPEKLSASSGTRNVLPWRIPA